MILVEGFIHVDGLYPTVTGTNHLWCFHSGACFLSLGGAFTFERNTWYYRITSFQLCFWGSWLYSILQLAQMGLPSHSVYIWTQL